MVKGLRELGHDVVDIREEGLENLSDQQLFQLAQEQKRVLVSMDKDFSNILEYPPGQHQGIIVIKLYRLTVAEATHLFVEAIRKVKPEDISGNLVLVDSAKVRIRRERF